jgi:mRNA interferase MazF
MVSRGEVWWTNLEPTVGVETQKRRPCVVVSPPEVNDNLRIVIVAPLTSGSRPAVSRVPTRFGNRGGFVLLEQVRAVDRSRLNPLMGSLDAAEMDQVLTVLRAMFSP